MSSSLINNGKIIFNSLVELTPEQQVDAILSTLRASEEPLKCGKMAWLMNNCLSTEQHRKISKVLRARSVNGGEALALFWAIPVPLTEQ
ncbi:hypothetical protein [Ktedonospora formicarum]|uniref:Uncharacterized protein n=1 Tax=Ktedonospora formicarum TaxID=2778364 RepID=A0A8J3MSM2_9CHLR|nr:hypothetical protein [Ktedonospora formicarum]GHO47217.1 hypothetical protein KSX_53800 [Ktedonospora formicarum]